MPTNSYFTQGTSGEQQLVEDLVVEQIKMFGVELYYIPKTLVSEDTVLGEDSLNSFDSAYQIEGYLENVQGFGGDGDLFSKFGVRIADQVNFIIARKRFQDLVDDNTTLVVEGRPNEGDILYFPLMNSFFEIQFVEDQEPFFQLGNLPVYKLRVTRWEYSNEGLDTGVQGIDDKDEAYSTNLLVDRIHLEDGKGTIQLEQDDEASGNANFLINESYDSTKVTVQTQSTYAQNLDLDTAAGFDTATVADDVLDFTERNPFGEVDEV